MSAVELFDWGTLPWRTLRPGTWLCFHDGPVQPHHNGLVEVCPHCARLLSVTVPTRGKDYVSARPAMPACLPQRPPVH